MHGSKIFNKGGKIESRRELRKCSTEAEKVLWRYLRNRRCECYKFRRQVSIGPYIADFYCAECRLIVELDGSPHFTEEGVKDDQERTEYLEGRGLKVIRFENKVVLGDLDFVLGRIKMALDGPPRPR